MKIANFIATKMKYKLAYLVPENSRYSPDENSIM